MNMHYDQSKGKIVNQIRAGHAYFSSMSASSRFFKEAFSVYEEERQETGDERQETEEGKERPMMKDKRLGRKKRKGVRGGRGK